MKNKPIGRVMPPCWKFNIQVEFHRQFTLRERVKILLGFNADIKLAIVTQHHCGQFSPAMDLSVTAAVKQKSS